MWHTETVVVWVFKPGRASYYLCDFGKVTFSLCVLVLIGINNVHIPPHPTPSHPNHENMYIPHHLQLRKDDLLESV